MYLEILADMLTRETRNRRNLILTVMFHTGAVGVIYFILTLGLLGYLTYLSVVDIKKHQLEYWQTGCLYSLAIVNVVLCALAENTYLRSVHAAEIPWKQYLINHGLTGLVVFVFILALAMIKIKGKNAIGGADIWVFAAVSLVTGFTYLPYMLIGTCVSYLLYALIYRIRKKEKLKMVAFVPFISIGTLFALVLSMV